MTEYRIPDHLVAELIDLVEAADVNAAERTAADYAGNNQRRCPSRAASTDTSIRTTRLNSTDGTACNVWA